MRRFYERHRPTSFFRGGEMGRLLVMMGMLVVLGMMIAKARDPNVWRWFTGEAETELAAAPDDAAANPDKQAANPDKPAAAPRELIVAGPTDEDAQEQETAKRLYEGITDKAPLDAAEMPAYWRQMQWTLAQSYQTLARRARTTVRFADLFHAPERYRGEIFKLRLHLRQVVVHDKIEEKIPGVKDVYQVVGWNDESHPYSYWLVCPELPQGMPRGLKLHEEGTFVGYFFKQTLYEDHEGKQRATPILIGRLQWHPPHNARKVDVEAGLLVPLVIGGAAIVLAFVFGGMWLARRRGPQRRSSIKRMLGESESSTDIESWLNGAESEGEGAADSAIIQPPDDDGNEAGRPRRLADRPDWPDG